MKVVRVARRAFGLQPQERQQALVAATLLGYANLALKFLPFAKAISLGSVRLNSRFADRELALRESVRAVERASHAVPWRAVCIHQGLALQRMLRRQGVAALLCYGTRQFGGKLQSHVWVTVGDEIVIGGEEAPKFHLVAIYPRSEKSSTSRPSSSRSS